MVSASSTTFDPKKLDDKRLGSAYYDVIDYSNCMLSSFSSFNTAR